MGLLALMPPLAGLILGFIYPRPMVFLIPLVSGAIYYAGLRLSWWTTGNEVGWGSATVWTSIIVLAAVIVGIALAALVRNPVAKD